MLNFKDPTDYIALYKVLANKKYNENLSYTNVREFTPSYTKRQEQFVLTPIKKLGAPNKN